MSQRDRIADTALGLVVGLGIAILILVWAVPGFRDPANGKDRQQHAEQTTNRNKKPVETPSFWKIYTTPSDTYAQWIAAFSALFSVAVSTWAVWLVRSTLAVNLKATKAAEDAVIETRRIGERQVRAYLNVVRIELQHVNDGFAPTITVTYKNFGQSPARDTVNDIVISFTLIGRPSHKDRVSRPKAGYDMGPGQESNTTTHFSFDSVDGLRDALEAGGAKMYVYGKISYRDVFDEPRYTRYKFRLHVNPEGLEDTDSFIICDDGNEST